MPDWTTTNGITYPTTDPTGDAGLKLKDNFEVLGVRALTGVCDGRLTLESGTAVPTSDQSAKTTVYLTPYQGNEIGLYDQGMWELAALVFLASILAPFLQIAGLLYLLVPLKLGVRPWKLGPVYRLVGKIAFWAMLEVYMLGIFVALVKLADFGTVVPDVALYAFFCLMLALAAASYSLDPRTIWQRVELPS